MRRGGLWFGTVCAALVAFSPVAEAQWPGPGYSRDWQGRREHCERMRDRLHQLRYRIQYAPPWERERIERRLYEIRQRLRTECWGHWRGN